MAAANQRPELLVIVGTTASGKSDLALKIAKKNSGEIISADSWTVYRGFNIGTAKPTSQDQKAVKHWLIDVREPNESFNAPMFKQMAQKAIADIENRDKLAIMAGGTGLYIDSVLYDFGFLPDSSPQQRQKLNMLSLPELIQMAAVENIDLRDIDIRNKRRVIRAIESGGQKPTKGELKEGVLLIGLKVPRDELKKRIEHRINQMLAAGLEGEVRELSGRYGWDIEPMKGIGYREWQQYFEGLQTLEQTRQRIISSTMNLAKRQQTWFKRNKKITWFESSDEALEYIGTTLNNSVMS